MLADLWLTLNEMGVKCLAQCLVHSSADTYWLLCNDGDGDDGDDVPSGSTARRGEMKWEGYLNSSGIY